MVPPASCTLQWLVGARGWQGGFHSGSWALRYEAGSDSSAGMIDDAGMGRDMGD